MINRIVLVGRVTRAPELNPQTGCCTFRLQVDHRNSPSSETTSDTSPVEIEVLVHDRRRGETVQRYVEAQNHLMLTGRLAQPGELTRVSLETWQFLPEGLLHVDFREEAFRSPAPSARAAA